MTNRDDYARHTQNGTQRQRAFEHLVGVTPMDPTAEESARTSSAAEETDYSPRTDLAIEAHDMAKRAANRPVRGVSSETEELPEGIRVTRVHVTSKEGEKRIGKRKGKYVTLEVPGLRRRDPDLQRIVSEKLARELDEFLKLPKKATVLVVGLGNSHVTPDALGPLVVDRLFVTRHLFEYLPEAVDEGYRTVAAISPGVLGITGIETSEVVKGIVEHVKPHAVVAIDALASRSLDRVNSTIQIADTGVHPGSGVGNKRRAIDEETLGVPCIAIGVPTVVDAATIANDAIELVLGHLNDAVPGNAANEIFDKFSSAEKWQMIRELLEPLGNNLMVTPKEIDEFVEDIAQVIAQGLNASLHPNMTFDEAESVSH